MQKYTRFRLMQEGEFGDCKGKISASMKAFYSFQLVVLGLCKGSRKDFLTSNRKEKKKRTYSNILLSCLY